MENKNYLSWVSSKSGHQKITVWANGKEGFIKDLSSNGILQFVECYDGCYKYQQAEWITNCPQIAFGIIAWWLKYRERFSITELYEKYYQCRLDQYREKREKQADSWDVDIEEEFLDGRYYQFETELIKKCEGIYEFFNEEECNTIRNVAKNYLQFLESKNNSQIPLNQIMSKNEIIVLKHLYDGKEHAETPAGLTDAQFYTTLRSLKSKNMVYAGFVEGGAVETSRIKIAGTAYIDDIKASERRILRTLLREQDLTADQYDLLQYAKKNGKCENIFGISERDYKSQIWVPMYDNKYLQTITNQHHQKSLVLSRLGEQVIEEIEDELYSLIADELKKEELQTIEIEKENGESSQEDVIKYSGFRIKDERITDVIKTIWSMHDVDMFVTPDGKKPTLISVMEAFAVFLQSKQLNNYSVYMNKALQTTKNTYLNVFYEMEDSAEKYYDDKDSRKQVK